MSAQETITGSQVAPPQDIKTKVISESRHESHGSGVNIDILDPELPQESTTKPPQTPQNDIDAYEESLELETDESQKSEAEHTPLKEEVHKTEQLKDEGTNTSQSFGRVISNTVRYKIPRSISRTHLKDTIQFGYLFVWLLALILSSMVVVGDWFFVKFLNINICHVEDNIDGDLHSVDFMSWNAFAGLIQQIWLVIVCLGGFNFFYMPNLVGITENEDDSKRIRTARIKLFVVMILTQIIVNVFLVPVKYNFRSIFNVLTLCFFLLWAYYERKCAGVRALYPYWAVIFGAVLLYYVLGGMIFTSMPTSLYATMYPFFLSFSNFCLIKMLEYLDGCKCCKPGIEIEMSDDQRSGSTRRRCMKRMEFWRQTSAVQSWPTFWVYYACGLIVVMSESFRIASYVVIVKESVTDLLTSFVIGMISEILTRNMVHKIIWDKYIMKNKRSSKLTTVRAIYLGCKYHTDYIPVLILVACNILGFGHTNDCYYTKVAFSMDIRNGYEWMIGVFVVYEMLTDTLTYVVYRLLKKFKILTQDHQDKTIKMAIVMLTRPQMFTMMLSLGYWSFVAFIYDDSSRPQQP